jgi:hypothetical protein
MRIARILIALPLALAMTSCANESGGIEQELANMDATVMRHERLIAECMESRGWVYVPSIPHSLLLEREHALADAQGRTFDPSSVELPPDPNDEIVTKLSEVEKAARATDYWGDLESGGTDPGCYRLTYERAWGAYPLIDPELVADMDAAVEADRRTVAARERYTICMADRGYEVAGPIDVFRKYTIKEEQLSEAIRAGGGVPDQSPLMKALQAEKVAAFAAHDECVLDYRRVEEQVRRDYLKEHLGR